MTIFFFSFFQVCVDNRVLRSSMDCSDYYVYVCIKHFQIQYYDSIFHPGDHVNSLTRYVTKMIKIEWRVEE